MKLMRRPRPPFAERTVEHVLFTSRWLLLRSISAWLLTLPSALRAPRTATRGKRWSSAIDPGDAVPQAGDRAVRRPTVQRHALLIVNTHSRRGAGAAETIAHTLERAAVPVLRRTCEDAGKLPDLIRGHADQVDRVVIGGGDGTLNAAAPGLIATGLPLGVVPLGTANDLARTLGIPLDPATAAQVVAAGRRRRIDLGEANGHPFFNVASVGFGVDLTRALTRDSKRRWGVLGYPAAALRALERLHPFEVEIVQNGITHRSRTVHVAIGNGRHYGGGMTIAEGARIDDGRLDIYSLEVGSFWRLLLLLPALRSGRHHVWAEIRTLTGNDIELRTQRPRSVNTDGEITTRTPARFRVLRGAVEVYVP
ncbi:MAG TPA: lipid kinase [Crenalkalicoccus sp.]|nr:lipid kinase [Crenalkalicoccus sp.]